MHAGSYRCCKGSAQMARGAVSACLLAWVSQAEAGGAKTVYALRQVELETPSVCYLQSSGSNVKPAQAGAMPAFESGEAVFMELRLGDGAPRLVAVERVSGGDQPGFRVYVDENGNRALADETPRETCEDPKLRRGKVQFTQPLKVPVIYRLPSGEVTRDCCFRLGFYPVPAERQSHDKRLFYSAQLVALQGWSGPVTFGDKTLTLTLSDGDGDAKTQVANTVSRDGLRLEGLSQTLSQTSQPLTRFLDVDGVLYNLEVQPDGAKVAVSRYTGELGTVAWSASSGTGAPAELAPLSFTGANLAFSRQGSDPASHRVPPGDYHLYYMIGKQNPRAYFRVSAPLRVSAGATSRIECGGPVIVSGSVKQQEGARETTLTVSIKTANAAGHDFQLLGSRSAGTVDVLGPDGSPQGTGTMEYG